MLKNWNYFFSVLMLLMIAGCNNEKPATPVTGTVGTAHVKVVPGGGAGQAPLTVTAPPPSSPGNAAGSHGTVKVVTNGIAKKPAPLMAATASAKRAATVPTLTSISIVPANSGTALGMAQQLTASGLYSDGTTKNLTTVVDWKSINTSIASVSNATESHGLMQSVAVGSTTISAAFGAVSGSTQFTVTAATITTLFVTPGNAKTPLGVAKRFAATGIYSDGSIRNLTNTAIWKAEEGTVTTVSNASGSHGQATPLAIGSTKISATVGAVTVSTPFTVTEAKLASILVTPVNPIAYPGFAEQLTATGTYTDGSTKNITDTVSWKAAHPVFAVISNAPGSNGQVTPVAVGSTAISATLAGVTGSTTLAVTKITTAPKAPTGVAVNSSIIKGMGPLTISWPTVSGATSYNLYIYTPGGNRAARALFYVTSPYVQVFDLGTYYFVVTAVNSYGESGPSTAANSTVY